MKRHSNLWWLAYAKSLRLRKVMPEHQIKQYVLRLRLHEREVLSRREKSGIIPDNNDK